MTLDSNPVVQAYNYGFRGHFSFFFSWPRTKVKVGKDSLGLEHLSLNIPQKLQQLHMWSRTNPFSSQTYPSSCILYLHHFYPNPLRRTRLSETIMLLFLSSYHHICFYHLHLLSSPALCFPLAWPYRFNSGSWMFLPRTIKITKK